MVTAWALKAMPGTIAGDGPPVRLTDRHDADGRGRTARRDAELLEHDLGDDVHCQAIAAGSRSRRCRAIALSPSFPIHWGGPAVGKDPTDFIG